MRAVLLDESLGFLIRAPAEVLLEDNSSPGDAEVEPKRDSEREDWRGLGNEVIALSQTLPNRHSNPGK
jgi:hypothetical protein